MADLANPEPVVNLDEPRPEVHQGGSAVPAPHASEDGIGFYPSHTDLSPSTIAQLFAQQPEVPDRKPNAGPMVANLSLVFKLIEKFAEAMAKVRKWKTELKHDHGNVETAVDDLRLMPSRKNTPTVDETEHALRLLNELRDHGVITERAYDELYPAISALTNAVKDLLKLADRG